MSTFQALVLGIVQGFSELLPISSSAHLYVIPTLLHWPYAGVAFDVALHWGTLLALVVAFWGDWWRMTRDAVTGAGPERILAWTTIGKLALASVPAAVAGVLLGDQAEMMLRSLPLQAVMLAVFGLLLWGVDRLAPSRHDGIPGWGPALLMGAAQALALVPGVSRSGVTITAGRAAGQTRISAARFSFLLATPITFGAGLIELRHLPHTLPLGTLAIGVGAAAVTGFIAIRGLLAWLGRAGFGVFFAYRVAFAALILIAMPRGH
ncbi:MAG: undecaprenyl-diphosphate phosphatase [Candidatus Eisenbacteria bacterium]